MSNVISQNQAVFLACVTVLGETFGGEIAAKPNTDERKKIVEIVTNGIIEGSVFMKDESRAKFNTTEKMRGYVVGMVSNHLRKDERLNGGVEHEIKNPGSRAGQGDEVLKNYKALLTTLTDPEQKKLVQAAIDERAKELAAAKAKTVTINVDLLPESLRHLATKAS